MDAQAELRLCCSETSEERFSRVETHIIVGSDLIFIKYMYNEIKKKKENMLQNISIPH